MYIIAGSSKAAEGDLLWEKSFGDFNDDWGYSVQQTADGGYIIAGYTYFYELMDDDVSLVKTNSDGDLQWQKTFGGGGDDRGYSVQQTADSGYILGGYTTASNFTVGTQDILAIKTLSGGNINWAKAYGYSASVD